jgi:SM-20-related protein
MLCANRSFIRYLNESCYTGITGYEFHYSYTKKEILPQHFDQFQSNLVENIP